MNRRTFLLGIAGAGVLAASGVYVLSPSSALATPEHIRAAIELRYPQVDWVSTRALSNALRASSAGDRALLLDVRAQAEFQVSHLRGARRVSPDMTEFAALGISAEQPVVVYCSVGWRSGILADRMRQAGFRNVKNLDGGLFRWANEGRPLYQGSERVTTVHPFDRTWGRFLAESRRAPL